MDEIKVKVSFKDEWQPRFYTVTGGEFTAMKDAVKAQPNSSFDGTLRMWSIRWATVEALRAAGYKVTEMPIARLTPLQNMMRNQNVLTVSMEVLNERGDYRAIATEEWRGEGEEVLLARLEAKREELKTIRKEYNAMKTRTRAAFVETFKKFNLKEASHAA